MPGSVISVITDPENFESALRDDGCVAMWTTGRGRFQVRLTVVALSNLSLSVVDERLARIAFVAVPVGVVLISFGIGRSSAPVFGGIRPRASEIIILPPGQQIHV